MNKRNDQLRKTKTIESDDQAVKSSKPNKQMIGLLIQWSSFHKFPVPPTLSITYFITLRNPQLTIKSCIISNDVLLFVIGYS